MLALAAAVEGQSEHPLAHAIVVAAKERGLQLGTVADFASQTGLGVSARVGGRSVVIGNAVQMSRIGADLKPVDAAADRHRGEGAGIILVAIDGALAGLLAIADPVRASARDAIAALRKEGLRVVMLTGDNRGTADAVARAVGGLDDVRADLLPEDKARIIGELKARRRKGRNGGRWDQRRPGARRRGCRLGDGNGNRRGDRKRRHDAHAAISRRSCAPASSLARRCEIFAKTCSSRSCSTGLVCQSRRNVLYPVAGILLSPMLAGAAMAISSFTVVLNALRLNAVKL
jgi:Cu+-exporting ATPase